MACNSNRNASVMEINCRTSQLKCFKCFHYYTIGKASLQYWMLVIVKAECRGVHHVPTSSISMKTMSTSGQINESNLKNVNAQEYSISHLSSQIIDVVLIVYSNQTLGILLFSLALVQRCANCILSYYCAYFGSYWTSVYLFFCNFCFNKNCTFSNSFQTFKK